MTSLDPGPTYGGLSPDTTKAPAKIAGMFDAIAISRALHVVTVVSLGALGVIGGLGPIYQGGVALVAALLVFEQSLVSATDLSQVKRAFDMNGWVGLLYLATTGLSIYVS